MGALFDEYQKSPEFKQLAPATQFIYARAIKNMETAPDNVAAVRVSQFKRRHVLIFRDYFSETPGLANQMLTAISRIMSYAVDREIDGVEVNVALRVPRLKGGEWKRWTDDALAKAMAEMPEQLRRALVLGLYTGQRISDCLSMRWSAYDGQGISVIQQKTKEPLYIPCHPALKAELDTWKKDPRVAVTVLANSFGKPWTMNGFKCEWAKIKRKLDIPFQFHGLRKTAAAKLAEAGCSDREIMAITGHRTASEVERYTREAEQKKRALSAMKKLEAAADTVPFPTRKTGL
ncbi:tyrosine-type recombinase/integrase [Azospirillum argentinense]|nr:tyrosine-type recombinase/integrase [Azospirillum argentinense]